jgi:hypothetical protein
MSWNCHSSKSEKRTPRSHNSADNERPQPHLMTWLSPPTVIECKKPALADQGDCQEETEFTPLNGAAHVRCYSQLEHSISPTTGRDNPMSAPTLIRRPRSFDPESDTGRRGLRPVTPRGEGDYLRSSRASISLAANYEDRLPSMDAGTPLNDSNHRTAPFLTLWPLAVLIFYSEFFFSTTSPVIYLIVRVRHPR